MNNVLIYAISDGFIIDNSIHASEQDVHLEDFFWTGSGDGAPLYSRRPTSVDGTEHVHDIFVKTSTVLATVYVDASLVSVKINITFLIFFSLQKKNKTHDFTIHFHVSKRMMIPIICV